MDASRIAKLTEAQKACLRLVLRHYEVKDIARELGITPTAVVERLRSARQIVGASRSMEAARIVANSENLGHIRDVDIPTVLDGALVDVPSITSVETENGEKGNRPISVREVQAQYVAGFVQRSTDDQDLSIRIPFIGGRRDDLKLWQILCFCLAVGALTIIAIAVLVKVDFEVTTSLHHR